MRRRKPISFSAAQGFENVEQRAINLPEKGLWCEVLLEALANLRRNRYRRPAMAWIKSNGQGVGSFVGFAIALIWIAVRYGEHYLAIIKCFREDSGCPENNATR